ncbi:hypothetical protein D3C74_361830 [compost metagenome]
MKALKLPASVKPNITLTTRKRAVMIKAGNNPEKVAATVGGTDLGILIVNFLSNKKI